MATLTFNFAAVRLFEETGRREDCLGSRKTRHESLPRAANSPERANLQVSCSSQPTIYGFEATAESLDAVLTPIVAPLLTETSGTSWLWPASPPSILLALHHSINQRTSLKKAQLDAPLFASGPRLGGLGISTEPVSSITEFAFCASAHLSPLGSPSCSPPNI